MGSVVASLGNFFLGGGIFHTRVEKIGVFLHIFGAEGTAKNFWAFFSKFLGNLLITYNYL